MIKNEYSPLRLTESIYNFVLGRGIIVVVRPVVRLAGLSYRKDLDILQFKCRRDPTPFEIADNVVESQF